MKILIDGHYIGERKTGLESYTLNLIREFSGEKINLLVYLPKIKSGLFRVLLGLNIVSIRLKPDILHVSYFAPFVKTVPTVLTVHDLCFKTFPEAFPIKTLFAFNLFFKKSLNRADAIICVSETTKKQLVNLYDLNPDKVFTVYEASDENFKYLSNKKRLRNALNEKFGIKGDYFLVVGNIEKRKNLIPVIESFIKLSKKNKNIQLIFAGQNKMGDLITKKYEKEIKKGRLKILGYVSKEDLNFLYNGSLALIYNSLCEGFGLPIIEAMITKTAVICNNLEVFNEITKDSAITYNYKDELYRVMDKVMNDKKFRKKYQELGYRRSRFFSWDKTAKETLKVYKWAYKSK